MTDADPNGGSDDPAVPSVPPISQVRPPADSLINTKHGRDYWEGIDADVNGMLGGFPEISNVDLKGSRALLARFGIGSNAKLQKAKRVLEGGAGIGRITLGLLVDVAEIVDIVEPIAKFTGPLEGKPGVGRIFNVGLEEWDPKSDDKYDVIWNQWCVGHLNDSQLINYLRRCGAALTPETGLIVVKENLAKKVDEFDVVDSSVTRTEDKLKTIYQEAGLRVMHSQVQNGLPVGLFKVMMYALKPINN